MRRRRRRDAPADDTEPHTHAGPPPVPAVDEIGERYGAASAAPSVAVSAYLQSRALSELAAAEIEEHGANGPIESAWLAERRRLRQAYERWRQGLAALLLFPRRAWRERQRGPLATRAWYERAEALAGPGATGAAPRLAGFIAAASPSITEAAVVVTALALGLGGTALSTDHPGAVPVHQAAAAASGGWVSAGPRPEITPAALEPTAPQPSEASASPAASPAPAPGAAIGAPPAPLPATPAPTVVEAETGSATESPIRQEPYASGHNHNSPGSSYETPSSRVAVDADGDGDPEADVGTPYVFVDCTQPDKRGPVMDSTCSMLEASGLGG